MRAMQHVSCCAAAWQLAHMSFAKLGRVTARKP